MRKIIIILFFLFPFLCNSHSKPYYEAHKDTINIDSLVLFVKKQIGVKYCYANCSPKSGFDCSGFVYYVFSHFNLKVPRSSMDYEKKGKFISLDSCKIGDVIVFTGTNAKNRRPGHVGIILSNPGEEIKFIHSSSSKKCSGVKISTFKESPYYKVRFIKIVRVATVI
ncbi:MAG: C40 family peptidase [Bacteroidota bacterium]|nr:C40 family peptidase [Bacteroidota bacterium]MDP3146106.1 C40 family peptidase [Bacteroidota bacterium]MDP3556736.1 C40 family peptidase [Bacteroidota bacterium]